MENQHFAYGEDVTDEQADAFFAEAARKYLETLNIQPFNPEGLELVRSEKEINKCTLIREQMKERELKLEEKKQMDRPESKRKTEMTKAKKIFKKPGQPVSKKNFKRRR